MILNSECQKEKKKHAFINIHQVFPGILYKFCVGLVVQIDLPDLIHRDTYISPPGSAWSFIYSLITGATARLMTLFKTFFGNKKTNDWALDMCPSVFFSKLS